MTSLALCLAIRLAARHMGAPPFDGHGGVNLKQELRKIDWSRADLKLIDRAREQKTIALTFDDGPHAGKTPKLLQILKELDVKATFFLVGRMVDRYPWLVRQELEEGHEVANHTYHHPNLETLSEFQVEEEYRACSDSIRRATGRAPLFCRPPGGRFDTEVLKAASDLGMWTVLWTDDPGDFQRPEPQVIAERVDRQMKNGGILLLHDGIPQTMEVLPELVRELRRRGYRFVTCSELLAQQSTKLVHGRQR